MKNLKESRSRSRGRNVPRAGSRGSAAGRQASESASVAKRAKKKFKQIQTKKANDRLARLEKMYQELTECEANANI